VSQLEYLRGFSPVDNSTLCGAELQTNVSEAFGCKPADASGSTMNIKAKSEAHWIQYLDTVANN
jgi:hypothetical protein